MSREEFYKYHKKIRVPICFYMDDNGKYYYDLETMAEEFERELSKLTKTTVMCSIKEDIDG